jgi:hypothetical protein
MKIGMAVPALSARRGQQRKVSSRCYTSFDKTMMLDAIMRMKLVPPNAQPIMYF